MKNDIYGVKFALVLLTKLTEGRFFIKNWKKLIRINLNPKLLVSQRFRTLGCPPAVGPAKQSKILGPFRRGVSRFRCFAFRVSLSRFRYTQGGVLPNIQAVLLPKKTDKPAKA